MKHHVVTTPLFTPTQQSSCSYSKSYVGAQMSSFINIQAGVESNLQKAVAYVGPVSVAVDASNKAFRVRDNNWVEENYPILCVLCM